MSIVAEVLFKSKATDTAHHLLMVLAAYNDLYGPEHTFPTVATLARHIHKQPRYTQKLIRRLEKDGHLLVRRAHSLEESGPNLYTVLRPWRRDVPQDTPVTQAISVLRDIPDLQDMPGLQSLPVPGHPVLQDPQSFLEKEREEKSRLAVPPAREASRTGGLYDTAKYHLGKLCKRRHDWQGTGQSLYRTKYRTCYTCHVTLQQARRDKQRTQG